MENKVSVIVPIYNVEKFLRQCLDSIIGQTYKNLEIILIDDGSPDNCGAICDEYAAKDDRIVVIHKQNGGLSAARNDGIARATGDWIAFVDSDDWCEPDYYETMLEQVREMTPDVIIASGHYLEYPKQRREVRHFQETGSYKDKEHIEELMAQIITYGLPWDKLYKAAFLKDSGIRFDISIRAFEDFLFNFQIFDEAKSVRMCPVSGYHYRQVAASIANGFNPNKPKLNYAFLSKLHDYAEERGASAKVMDGINAVAICAIKVAMDCCYFHPENPKKRKQVAQEINDMIQRPYCREAIYSSSNRYLTAKQIVLKYALRMKREGILRMLHTAKQALKPQ